MITGGCLCGKIRYEAEVESFLAIRCHCRDCQYVSGGEPAAVVSFARDALGFKANRARIGQRPILVLLFSGRSVRTAVRLCSLATRNDAEFIAVKLGSSRRAIQVHASRSYMAHWCKLVCGNQSTSIMPFALPSGPSQQIFSRASYLYSVKLFSVGGLL